MIIYGVQLVHYLVKQSIKLEGLRYKILACIGTRYIEARSEV